MLHFCISEDLLAGDSYLYLINVKSMFYALLDVNIIIKKGTLI